jgi:hypothetical protein
MSARQGIWLASWAPATREQRHRSADGRAGKHQRARRPWKMGEGVPVEEGAMAMASWSAAMGRARQPDLGREDEERRRHGRGTGAR